MPALGIADEIACTPDIEIARADGEACAEAVQRFQRTQTLLGRFGECGARFGGQQDVAATTATADASAQLVKLGEAKAVGAPDDHRVGARHIEARLDDVGGEKNVVEAVGEAHHRGVDFRRWHLTMGLQHRQIRRQPLQRRGERGQVLDAWHHHKALPAPVALAQQRRAHLMLIEHAGERADGLASRGRRCDDRHLLEAQQRVLQRARNWRCGEAQQVAAITGKIAQLCLVGGPEALLLVDHHEREVGILHLFRSHRPGTDHDRDRAIGKARLHTLALGGIGETRQGRDLDAHPLEARAKCLVVLAHQNGCRRGNHDLLPGKSRQSSSAQRHFGLSIADVTDHEAVHRLAGSKILADSHDRAGLVRRFGKGKSDDEFAIGGGIRIDLHRTLLRMRLGENSEFGGRFGHRLVNDETPLAPACAIETVERHRRAIRPIAPDAISLLDRHQATRATGVFELDAFHHGARTSRAAKAGDHRDAVVFVDHHIADADVANLEQMRAVVARIRRKTALSAQNLARCDHEPARLAPAQRQLHLKQLHAVEPARVGFLPVADRPGAGADLARQPLLQEPQLLVRPSHDDAGAFLQSCRDLVVHRLHRINMGGKADHALIRAGRQIKAAALGGSPIPDCLRDNVLAGRRSFLARAVRSVIRERKEAFALACRAGIQRDDGVGEIVEQRIAASEHGGPRGRTKVDMLQVAHATLADRVEFADTLNGAIGNLDAYGTLGIGGVDVDHAPAHGELGGLIDAIILEIADAAHDLPEHIRLDAAAHREAGQLSIEGLWLGQHLAGRLGSGDADDLLRLGACKLAGAAQRGEADA